MNPDLLSRRATSRRSTSTRREYEKTKNIVSWADERRWWVWGAEPPPQQNASSLQTSHVKAQSKSNLTKYVPKPRYPDSLRIQDCSMSWQSYRVARASHILKMQSCDAKQIIQELNTLADIRSSPRWICNNYLIFVTIPESRYCLFA